MDLGDFTEQQQLALCVLVKHMIRSDGQLTDEEIGAVSDVADEMGHDAWRAAFRQVAFKTTTNREVMGVAKTIDDPEVRRKVRDVLAMVAQADDLVVQEARFLEALDGLWTDS